MCHIIYWYWCLCVCVLYVNVCGCSCLCLHAKAKGGQWVSCCSSLCFTPLQQWLSLSLVLGWWLENPGSVCPHCYSPGLTIVVFFFLLLLQNGSWVIKECLIVMNKENTCFFFKFKPWLCVKKKKTTHFFSTVVNSHMVSLLRTWWCVSCHH